MPSSGSKKKKQPENEAKKSNRNSPGTRAAKVPQTDSRVETPITLPATTSASADSLPPPVGGDTMISVHASSKAGSAESVDNPVDQYMRDNVTPSKSLNKDLREEDGPVPKDTSVTFNNTSLDHGVSAIKSEAAVTSITSDPRLSSRRGKARNEPVGRTSESFTRTDQAYTRWENSVYDSLFTEMPNDDSTATVAFILASGRHIKIGETLDKPLIEGHIKQLRQDLTFGQKEAILHEHLKPADKSKRTMPSVALHPSRRRRNTNDDEDSDSDSDSGSDPDTDPGDDASDIDEPYDPMPNLVDLSDDEDSDADSDADTDPDVDSTDTMSVQSDTEDPHIPLLSPDSDSDDDDEPDTYFPLEESITSNTRAEVRLTTLQPLQQSQDPTLASFMLTTIELLYDDTLLATGTCMLDTGALQASFIRQEVLDRYP